MTERGWTLIGRLIAGGLLCALVLSLWTHRGWFEPHAIALSLAHHAWAPVAFLLAHIVVGLSLVIPRTVMGIAAGLLFGLYWGLALTVLGTMLGAWAAFGVVRLYRRRQADMPRIGTIAGIARIRPWLVGFERTGWRGVWTLRLLPVMPHSPLNYALGFTTIGWADYSVGTLLGIVPSTVIAVAIGAAGGGALSGGPSDWLKPAALGSLGVALSLLAPRLRILRQRSTEKLSPGAP